MLLPLRQLLDVIGAITTPSRVFYCAADTTSQFALSADCASQFSQFADSTSTFYVAADPATSTEGDPMPYDNALLIRSAGDDFTMKFLCKDNGLPASYTSPTGKFSIGNSSDPVNGETPFLTKTASLAQVSGDWYATVSLVRSDTLAILPGVHYCELKITDGGNTLTVATIRINFRATIDHT